MSLHDAYARRTPFELAFPDRAAVDAFVAEVDEEAEAHGVDRSSRVAFSMLGAVGRTVHRLQGPDAPAAAIHDYIALLYHLYHFVRHGRPIHLVDVHAARFLVGRSPAGAGGEAGEPPAPAGYAQLPRHLFWVGGDDTTAEAVDGFFWTLSDESTLHLLLVTGIREGRGGFAVVPLPEAPWEEAADWLDAPVRAAGDDFRTTLPGGELEGLYSFTAAGEVLKLATRLFAYERLVPHAVERHLPPTDGHGSPGAGVTGEGGGAAEAGGGGPAPSRLPYRRVVLRG